MRDGSDTKALTKLGDIGGSRGYQGTTDLVLCASGRPGQVFGRVALSVLLVPQAWCDNSWPALVMMVVWLLLFISSYIVP